MHRRTVRAAALLVVALITNCGRAPQTSSTSSPSPSPTISSTPTPTATPVRPVAFYSLINDDGSEAGTFRTEVPAGKPSPVKMPGRDAAVFGSADGRHIAVATPRFGLGNALYVASSASLQWTRIATAPKDRSIASVIWAPDGATVFYTSAPVESAGEETIHRIGADGSGERSIASFPFGGGYEYRDLRGVTPAGDRIVWTIGVYDGEGGISQLSSTDVTSGKTTRHDAGMGNLQVEALVMAPAMDRAYFLKDATALVERTLATKSDRVLYRASGDERALERLVISPDGLLLVFQATQTPMFGEADIPNGATTTYRLPSAGGERAALLVERNGLDHLRVFAWAPDSRHLFAYAPADQLQGRIIDINTNQVSTLPDADKMAMRFGCWLAI